MLSMEDTKLIKWWVGGYYTVHGNIRSHIGVMISMGKGSLYSTSHKQKLINKTSTETEPVATDDVIPQLLCTRYFLEDLGHHGKAFKMYQFNMKSMILDKMVRCSVERRWGTSTFGTSL